MNHDKHLPMPLPQCPVHKTTMELRPLLQQTYEQQWCGTWYDCSEPHCKCSVLFPSKKIEDMHKKQKNRDKTTKR